MRARLGRAAMQQQKSEQRLEASRGKAGDRSAAVLDLELAQQANMQGRHNDHEPKRVLAALIGLEVRKRWHGFADRLIQLQRLRLDPQALPLVMLAGAAPWSTTAESIECLRARRVSAASPAARNRR